jgi:nicotinamidase-related amidase
MQRLFSENTDWATPWMARVTPLVEKLCQAHPDSLVFTRFIPAARPGEGEGVWARYWTRWASMTLQNLPADMTDLVPPLQRFAPPAPVIDKTHYSPWVSSALEAELKRRKSDTLIVTGGETDVCVLATVLGAVDRGYRIVLATDALCSGSDETHDAMIDVYHSRYDQQVETLQVDALLAEWR